MKDVKSLEEPHFMAVNSACCIFMFGPAADMVEEVRTPKRKS